MTEEQFTKNMLKLIEITTKNTLMVISQALDRCADYSAFRQFMHEWTDKFKNEPVSFKENENDDK